MRTKVVTRLFAVSFLLAVIFPAIACRPFGSYQFAEDEGGGIWFTEGDNNAVSRLAPDGTATAYRLPTANGEPSALALDGKGNLWFAEMDGSKIGRLDRSGRITEFPTAGGQPFALVVDGQDRVWYVQMAHEMPMASAPGGVHVMGRSGVGRIDPDGATAFYPVAAGWVTSVAADPRGRVWAGILIPGEKDAKPRGRLVRLSQNFRWETVAAWNNSCPRNLLAGKDGRLYFSDGCRRIAAYRTPAGKLVRWPIPGKRGIQQMSLAPDGTLWFTDREHLGRIDRSGRVRFVRGEDNGDATMAVLALRNGDVVFSEFYNYDINRLKKSGEYVEHLVSIDQRHDSREVKDGEFCRIEFGARIAAKAEMDRKRAEEVRSGQFKPDGQGTEKLAEQKCLVCHDARRLLLSRRSDWTPSITRMHDYRRVRGVEPLSAEETARLTRYFNENYGTR